MANVSLELRSNLNPANLSIRLNYYDTENNLKSVRAQIQIQVSPSFWNEYKKRKDFRDTDKRNLKTEIDTERAKIETFILSHFETAPNIDSKWLKKVVNLYYNPPKKEKLPTDLLEYFDYYLSLKQYAKKHTVVKWNSVRKMVADFITQSDRFYFVKDVNEKFVTDWTTYGLNENYAPATIKKYFTFVKTVCRHAKGKGLEVSSDLDMIQVKIESEKLKKVYFDFDELKKIQSFTGLSESLENAKDWLLISCFTGQRISDFMRFHKSMIRKSHGRKFIDIKQVKTGKDVSIPITKEVAQILAKRDGEFPRKISSQRYNDYIKEVARLVGINEVMRGKVQQDVNGEPRKVIDDYKKYELVTSHIGRRSFATNFYGILPTSYLKNITGHSSESMLLIYIGKTSSDTAVDAYDILNNR